MRETLNDYCSRTDMQYLLDEWDEEKNIPLTPNNVTHGSGRKVWWHCAKGHSWQAAICGRTMGRKCPYCAGKKVDKNNSLAALYPELVKSWDTNKNVLQTPDDVRPGSHRRVWWKCEKGHSWQSTIYDRTSGKECPYCSGKKADKHNSLAALYPELVKSWDIDKNAPQTPDGVLPNSHRKVWWKCEKGHSYRTEIRMKTQGCKCPYCTNRKIIAEENSLAVTEPELAAQWDYALNGDLKPTHVVGGSKKKVWWRCEQGHSWCSKISSRVSGGTGCPVCAGRVVISGDNDLQTAFPEIAAQWDGEKNVALQPDQVTPFSNRKAWWICEKGHSYYMQISARTQRHCGCPYCAGVKVLPGFNDLASHYPDIAAQWHPSKNGSLTPDQVTCGSTKRVWWLCSRGHEWKSGIVVRAHKGSGCPVCTNRVVQTGYNDLQTLYPEVAAEWDIKKNAMLTPDQIGAGTNTKFWWRCRLGHSYQMSPWNRTSRNCECPYCTGRKVLVGFNDLGTKRPELAAQWHQRLNGALTPQMVTEHSNRDVWWQCSEGHVWTAQINRRSRGYCNCPVCNGRVNRIRSNKYKMLVESGKNANGYAIERQINI